MIPMRDGIRLCTDNYRPARNGVPVQERFPIILDRTPYGKSFFASSADYFVRRRYVVVFEGVRANAPYVKAMVPRNAMSNFGRYGVRHNGAFELRFFNPRLGRR